MKIKLGIILIMLAGMLVYGGTAVADSSREAYAQDVNYHMHKAKRMRELASKTGDDHYALLAIYHATMAANNLKLVELLSSKTGPIDSATRRALTE